MKEYIAVSACLLGLDTKYNGKNNYNEIVFDLIKNKTVLPICPEVFGGLATPRNPSEEKDDGNIYSSTGIDVTKEFILGKNITIKFLEKYNCKEVILKNGSPSCGNYSYDGSFTKTKVDRMGLTARELKEKGYIIHYID